VKTNTRILVSTERLTQGFAEQLRICGVPAGDVIAEDFGWCIPVESKLRSLYVVCANAEEKHHWRVFAFGAGGVVARLFGKEKSAESLLSLRTTVKSDLEAAPFILCVDYGSGLV
jgi:hypothetical protein